MTENPVSAAVCGGLALLERSVSYTLGSLHLVTEEALARPSPCAGWDLRALLLHMNDSLQALHEGVDLGHVRLAPHCFGDARVDPVATLRHRACSMLGAWTNAPDRDLVSIGGLPLTGGVLTATGALEITVHGWDVAQACDAVRPIPESLAEELLPLATMLVTGNDRPSRFAAPVDVLSTSRVGQQLVGFLGRTPKPG